MVSKLWLPFLAPSLQTLVLSLYQKSFELRTPEHQQQYTGKYVLSRSFQMSIKGPWMPKINIYHGCWSAS